MGRNHLRALAASTHVKVTAIAEPVESTRRSLQSNDIHMYADLDQVLDSAAIDAVLVCVPSDKHLATVKRLVSAGMQTSTASIAKNRSGSPRPTPSKPPRWWPPPGCHSRLDSGG